MTTDITNVLLLALIGMYLVLLGMILAYVYFDAEQRGVNGWVITGMAFFSGTIVGTLAWIIFRPKLKPQPIPVQK